METLILIVLAVVSISILYIYKIIEYYRLKSQLKKVRELNELLSAGIFSPKRIDKPAPAFNYARHIPGRVNGTLYKQKRKVS